MLNKRSLEQSKKIIDWQAFWGNKWTSFKKINIQGITNEKVKLLEISILNTEFYEEKCSKAAVDKCFIGERVLEIS